MTNSDGIFVLYKEEPRKRYRRIVVKGEEVFAHIQFLVEITEGAPFDIENGDVQIFQCATRSEAMPAQSKPYPEIKVRYDIVDGNVTLSVTNFGSAPAVSR